MFNDQIWMISQQNCSSKSISCPRILEQKYTLENGTSPDTPTYQVPPSGTKVRENYSITKYGTYILTFFLSDISRLPVQNARKVGTVIVT